MPGPGEPLERGVLARRPVVGGDLLDALREQHRMVMEADDDALVKQAPGVLRLIRCQPQVIGRDAINLGVEFEGLEVLAWREVRV
jgi:hypothetical protein